MAAAPGFVPLSVPAGAPGPLRTARGVFPSVRTRDQLRAAELEARLFESFVRTQLEDGCPGLPPERARGELADRYPSIADGSLELRDHALDRLHEGLDPDSGDLPDERKLHLEEARQALARLREGFTSEERFTPSRGRGDPAPGGMGSSGAACERALGLCELCLASFPFGADLRGDCGQAITACRDARQQCHDAF